MRVPGDFSRIGNASCPGIDKNCTGLVRVDHDLAKCKRLCVADRNGGDDRGRGFGRSRGAGLRFYTLCREPCKKKVFRMTIRFVIN